MIAALNRLAQALCLCIGFATFTHANDLGTPQGEIILTVTGQIEGSNAREAAVFDLDMLRALDATQITTDTNWTEGVHTFTGVRLDILLDHIKANGNLISAVAINDYSVEIPVSDAEEGGPIIAYEMDGQPMSRRDKGPLWVIYPFASSSKFRSEVIYSRSIWQLDRMEIRQ
ncbi:molybdopterin-dependent oxidoreductase [Actibacterium pelagium]|uniref:Oxidoreductase n=1 Tax=Actibacterium pelagium TaxID=2029103 RepID=A0A917AN25_9RHOB|nr:molybdopterin-dependent oxidoreductase [Actibacterium pelagium]GGE62470.1 oxidoreductase [Actibacterium pelagium]